MMPERRGVMLRGPLRRQHRAIPFAGKRHEHHADVRQQREQGDADKKRRGESAPQPAERLARCRPSSPLPVMALPPPKASLLTGKAAPC